MILIIMIAVFFVVWLFSCWCDPNAGKWEKERRERMRRVYRKDK